MKDRGMDIVWLMGVWERSPASRRCALALEDLVRASRSILGDFRSDDVVGSPYAVHRYVPDPRLGSADELLQLKETLEGEGLRLLLDFVPNHTARDHPWVRKAPARYVQGRRTSSGGCEEGFYPLKERPGGVCIAHGRDPYFPPWTDTAQLNYFEPRAVHAMLETLEGIASYCDGVRCDMAMLVLRRIFERTWAPYLEGSGGAEEFWPLAVHRLERVAGSRLWLAEAYWGTEEELLRHGFNYVYDKSFYDLMVQGDVQGLRRQLSAPLVFQEKMARFLENHDEERAMTKLGPERIRCAMVVHGTLPGLRFWHHGQFDGRRVKVPIQLRREVEEIPEGDMVSFSGNLLRELDAPVFHEGDWELCDTAGWPDNQTHRNLLAWCWRLGEERRLIVANFCSSASQGYVRLPVGWLPEGETYSCRDPLKRKTFKGPLNEARKRGLYVGLGRWDYHFFAWDPQRR